MSQSMISTVGTESSAGNYRTTSDLALVRAWRLYRAFSDAAKRQKTWYTRLRSWVIWMGLTASVLAVLIALDFITLDIKGVMRVFLAILPITISIIMTIAVEVTPSVMWISYRFGAQSIMRHIYLYRMEAGPYRHDESITQKKKRLLHNIDPKNISENLESFEPFLQERNVDADSEQDEIVSYADKRDRGGDGFGPLTAKDYITHRALSQRNWYVNQMNKDYRNARINRFVILAVGGLGTIAAAISVDLAWLVVVTTAAVAALTTRMQLKMQGRTYANYHQAALQLDNILADWDLLPPQKQEEQIAILVTKVESTFEKEENVWMQQAIQSQEVGEKSLVKNLKEWSGKK